MKEITLAAPAKINLTLDILGLLKNGYHDMKMVMQAVDICDNITIRKENRQGIVFFCSNRQLASESGNTAVRAAELFFEATGWPKAVGIKLDKVIPMQAGMGGGSADAAAVLIGLDTLYETGLGLPKLCEIGVRIGADVPFCLNGGTALVEGIGERLTPLPFYGDYYLVIAKPRQGVSTASAFRAFDHCEVPRRPDTDRVVQGLERKNLFDLCEGVGNVLKEASSLKEIEIIENQMEALGAKKACMTGTGSAVFGIFDDGIQAQLCKKFLACQYDEVFLTRPVEGGPKILSTAE